MARRRRKKDEQSDTSTQTQTGKRRSYLQDFAQERGLVDADDDGLYWNGYSSYGYSTNYKGSSASSFWSSRFGWTSSYSSDRERFYDVLNTITRSANIVENARTEVGQGAERRFQCRWSDGKSVNKIETDDIFLTPHVLVKDFSLKPEWTEEQQTDVLIGQALTEAGIKTTTSIEGQKHLDKARVDAVADESDAKGELTKVDEEVNAFKDAHKRCVELGMKPEQQKLEKRMTVLDRHRSNINSKVLDSKLRQQAAKMADHIWYASEVLASQKQILNNYPGFKGYFSAQVEYYTHEPFKDKMVEAMGSGVKAAKLAENVLVWQMVHADVPMTLPPDYDEPIEDCIDLLEGAKNSGERADAAYEVAQRLLKLFPEQWDGGEDDQDGDGSGEKSDKKGKPKPGKPDGKPSHGDGNGLPHSNFNEVVANEHDKELAHQRADSDDGEPGGYGREKGDNYEQNIKEVMVTGNFDAEFAGYCRKLNPQIQALRNRLKLRNEIAQVREHGLRHGHLDEGSLYKLGFHKIGFADDRVFEEKNVLDTPELAVGILIDESGSMSCSDGAGHVKYEEAKKLCIIVAAALMGMPNVALSILGHTAEGRGHGGVHNSSGILLHHYLTPVNQNLGAITQIHSYSNNIDGYAIQATTKRMLEWHPEAKTRLLIHISDGYPAGSGYGGEPAMAHIRRVGNYAKRNNVQVFGVGIGEYFEAKTCDIMYGPGRWCKVDAAANAGIVISNLLSREVRKHAAL